MREILIRLEGRTNKQITVRLTELTTGTQRGISSLWNTQSSNGQGPIQPDLSWPCFEYIFRPDDSHRSFLKLFYNIVQIDINCCLAAKVNS